jgi:hypothetical protein
MSPTIPHPCAPAEDYRALARKVLAELPATEDTDRPWYWIGRLEIALRSLADVASPGGMDTGQREVLAAALADAVRYRTPEALCEDCETRPEGLCDDHAADLDLTDAYLALGCELGIEVDL